MVRERRPPGSLDVLWVLNGTNAGHYTPCATALSSISCLQEGHRFTRVNRRRRQDAGSRGPRVGCVTGDHIQSCQRSGHPASDVLAVLQPAIPTPVHTCEPVGLLQARN